MARASPMGQVMSHVMSHVMGHVMSHVMGHMMSHVMGHGGRRTSPPRALFGARAHRGHTARPFQCYMMKLIEMH